MIDAAREREVLLVYVNDCFGDWSANAATLSEQARGGGRARSSSSRSCPAPRSLRRQGAPLDLLPDAGRVPAAPGGNQRVVLVGQVTEQCILYSALDGYIRHSRWRSRPTRWRTSTPTSRHAALRMMELNMHARLVPAGADAFDPD